MKKGLKKIIATVLTMTMVMSVGLPAFAEKNNETNKYNFQNETDVYFHWQECSDEELIIEGYSQDEVKEIRNFKLETAFLDRAKLSEKELKALGYTENQISVLKNYNGEPITEDSPVLVAAANCTGTISKGDYTNNSTNISVQYTWEWDHEPLWAGNDLAVFAWTAYKASNSLEGYVEPVNSKSYAQLSLYSASTGNFVRRENVSLSINTVGGNATATSPVNLSGFWVKSGKIHLYLDASEVAIRKIEFSGALGHETVAISGGISFALTGLRITFSPSFFVSKEATVYAEALPGTSGCPITITGRE